MKDQQGPNLGPNPALRPKRDFLRDGIVLLSMVFVALAVGFGLHLQFGVALWAAVTAAVGVFLSMLFSHLILTQSREAGKLRLEVARLHAEIIELWLRARSAAGSDRAAAVCGWAGFGPFTTGGVGGSSGRG
jgi:hypothetical protein